MAGALVLLTGATGFLGHQVLIDMLHAGYRVRCAVRTAQGIESILASLDVHKFEMLLQHLSWVIVPNITTAGAYDKAVRDVDYIIHVASPVEGALGDQSGLQDAEEAFVKSAVAGTIGMLESAAAHGSSVRRIVITSSVVAALPRNLFEEATPPNTRPFTADHRLPRMSAPYKPGDAYVSSKIASLNASEAWMKEHKPSFDMISILPAWIWGGNGLATTKDQLSKGSNAVLLDILTGKMSQYPINSAVVSVKATAKAHVLALQPTVPGNRAFFAGRVENLDEINQIAKRKFPEAVAKGIFSAECRQATVSVPMDTEWTEKILGLEMDSLEDMVTEVAEQYLSFL